MSDVLVEIAGLSLRTHHGVGEAEREVGQRLIIDVSFDVPDCDAILTDRIDDTVDYGEVVELVSRLATERSYRTLERLCHVIAEAIGERWGPRRVRVRAAKPEPPIAAELGEVAVEVVRDSPREEDDDAVDDDLIDGAMDDPAGPQRRPDEDD